MVWYGNLQIVTKVLIVSYVTYEHDGNLKM